MIKAFAREAKDAVVVFTDISAKRAFDELGLSDRIQQVQIGQHHSPFEPFESNEPFATALRGAFRSVDAFTALSQKDADKFEALLGVPCFAVPNMLSPLRFSEAPSSTVVSRKAVALGRLSGEKQFEALILAFLQATDRDDLRDWTLDIYGDGEERRYLEALIIDRSAGDRVRLCGVAHDISRVFTDAALHISSSRWEGFGMSVLEAAQYGVPTVAFDCSPGLHDLMVVVHGELVPPADGVDGLASGIRELVADADSLRERGSWARDGAATYEPTRVLREWATVLHAAHSRLTALGGSRQNGGHA
ncbi:MAG: glycosyltransferase [Actinobacteria bacterium]|nr:glycosyltransferase [Actinomycetota bacterium]